MNTLSCLFLILVCFISSPVLTYSVPTLPITNHVLALTYSANYCRVNSCYGAIINFEAITIHGLWPNFYPPPQQPGETVADRPGDTPLQYCDLSSQLIASDLPQPITTELEIFWPSLTYYRVQGQPLGFWNYEWRKHGTCSNWWNNKFLYFQETLTIYHFVNPHLLLINFPPSYTVKYNENDIINYHIHRNFPLPYLSCTKVEPYDYLVKIYYCLDAAAGAVVDCRNYYSETSNCDSDGFYIFPME